ncbi:hypothetical protein SK128_004384, partial [Halocaridina rubra]
ENTANKENERCKKLQEISSHSQPSYVMKHKGRVKVPKVQFKDGMEQGSSPRGYKSPTRLEAVSPVRKSSVSSSLMEISLYEPHKTQYTNTLKKS